MSSKYKIIGAEGSPFSVKVRAYFRFKGLAHDWIPRSQKAYNQHKEYFKLPIIPAVISPSGDPLQDSTPILEALEEQYPESSIHPLDPSLKFISQMLEEFADEWANKWVFHFRWARDVDQIAAALRIAHTTDPDASDEDIAAMAEHVRERMIARLSFVGSNETTAPLIERGFVRAMDQLDDHLADRTYLLGERPSLADFGLWGQIYNLALDPTPAAMIGGKYQNLLRWIQRMSWPMVLGEFEAWDTLAATLEPFITDHVGTWFLPWSAANLTALENADAEFSVDLGGCVWTQSPQKYHAKSLKALREKFQNAPDPDQTRLILARTDCLRWLISHDEP